VIGHHGDALERSEVADADAGVRAQRTGVIAVEFLERRALPPAAVALPMAGTSTSV
jgi:hypothetical protein